MRSFNLEWIFNRVGRRRGLIKPLVCCIVSVVLNFVVVYNVIGIFLNIVHITRRIADQASQAECYEYRPRHLEESTRLTLVK